MRNELKKQILAGVLAVLMLLTVTGCDPGYIRLTISGGLLDSRVGRNYI